VYNLCKGLGRDCFNLFTVGWQRRQSFKLRMLQLAGIFTSVVRRLQCREIWELNGGSPPDKSWAAGCRKGTCIGYKILRTATKGYETAEGTRATQLSVEGSPERVHNGFSRSENLSGQLIEIKHSHQTHMIEISCEIPCCIPKRRRMSGWSTSLRPGEKWCHAVLKFA
jgi:hypothetical protein